MPDPYENLRRILVDATYIQDLPIDQQVRRTAEGAINAVRRMVRNGHELEQMVNQAACVGDVRTIIDKLEAIAEEEVREAQKFRL
jgi:DNA-binding FrmR family transcriptional regulator